MFFNKKTAHYVNLIIPRREKLLVRKIKERCRGRAIFNCPKKAENSTERRLFLLFVRINKQHLRTTRSKGNLIKNGIMKNRSSGRRGSGQTTKAVRAMRGREAVNHLKSEFFCPRCLRRKAVCDKQPPTERRPHRRREQRGPTTIYLGAGFLLTFF